MSASDDFKNPYTEDPNNHSTIANLVQGAHNTHRQSQEQLTRQHPRYPSEEKRSKITFDLDPDTIAELRDLVQKLNAQKRLSALTQALIEYALKAYKSGRIELQPRLGHKGVDFEAIEVPDNEN